MIKAAQTLIVFLLFSICLGFAASFAYLRPAFAQTSELQPKRDLHSYTQNVMIEVMSALTCQLAGVDPVDTSQKCLGINNGKIGPVDSSGGAIGVMGNLIAMTFTPPAHTGDYFSYLAGNFGISKPAYAQGIGFTGLSPLTNVWIAFRNIVYLLFVLVFVVIGFAIMLRVRIDPRTVMTIENQIPKIIIALILVTFSFAIAGFLIDLMYVFIYLVVNVFAQVDSKISADIAQATNPIQAANSMASGFGGFGNIAESAAKTVGSFFAPVFDNNLGRLLMGGFFVILGKLGGADLIFALITAAAVPIAAVTGGAAAIPLFIGGIAVKNIVETVVPGLLGTVAFTLAPQIAGFVGAILAFIVIIIAILWALFRLWFQLLKAYVMILIDVVFAPFWILLGLAPGSRLSFTGWLRDLGANLIAFPATIVMFLLGKVFIDVFAGAQGQPFVPPLIANPAATAIGNFIGLGIILLTPAVVDMMRKALQAPEIDLSMIFRAIGVGTGVTGIPTRLGALGMQWEYAKHLPFVGRYLRGTGQAATGLPPAPGGGP